MGAELDTISNRGISVSHMAAQYGSGPMMAELLRKGAPLFSTNSNGDTPLHFAAATGRSDVVEALLDFNAAQREDSLTEVRNSAGYAALHLATIGGHLDTAQRLMDSNVSFCDTSAPHGMNAALLAADKGDIELLRLFIGRGCDLEGFSGNGMTALHYAAANGHSDATIVLLEAGANTETKCLTNDWTALFYSTSNGHEVASRSLLAKGADMFSADSAGVSLVYYLIINDIAEGLRFLLDNGLSVEMADTFDQTLLHSTLRQKSPKVLQLLLMRGADPKSNAQGRSSTLHYAVHFDVDISAAALLVSHGADINCQDSNGLTALHVAAMQGKESWVGILLSLGANMYLEDLLGQTPLQIAALNNKSIIVTLLMCRDLQINP